MVVGSSPGALAARFGELIMGASPGSCKNSNHDDGDGLPGFALGIAKEGPAIAASRTETALKSFILK